MSAQICYCGFLKQEIKTMSDGTEYCAKCNLPTELSTLRLDSKTIEELAAAEAEALAKLAITGRSAKHNREIAESLIGELAKEKKYAKAIKNGNFATFSIMGTNDWEDYASLSIAALNLLAITRIDENLEKLVKILEKDS
jgi:hypothetical protein